MLRALTEEGIEPDLIVGSSAGAINAFCFAQQPTIAGLDRLARLWSGMRRRDIFPLSFGQMVAGLSGFRDGVVSSDRLRRYLTGKIGDADLTEATVPVHVVATDLADGQPVVWSSGPAVDALLASTAMPGVFPPVMIDGRLYVDGGVTADTPIKQAEDVGATVTYVLPAVGAEPSGMAPRGAVSVLLHAIGHLFGHAVATDLAAAQGKVHVLPAPAQGNANPFDFRHSVRMISEGYSMAKAALTAPPAVAWAS
jgi:NTE family protein